jgi:DNA uptake protein ComE-like DNA-binding protein
MNCMSHIRRWCRTALLTLFMMLGAGGAIAAELVVLVPMMAGDQVVLRAGPKGEAQSPILKRATADAITKTLMQEATRGSTKFMLELDEQAQRLAGVRSPAPTYLLVSKQHGSFARRGFWFADADNKIVWRADSYVELGVDKANIEDGSFEELFAHELGHVVLRRLFPRLPNGLSRNTHSSLAITDYPTAFEEGFAIHFQGLARQLTDNVKLKAFDRGLEFKPFLPYLQSNADRSLRVRGMRDNIFVHRQVPTALQVGDATMLFDLTHFKNGQQMLSSEGVIATLFYHLQLGPTDTMSALTDRYRSLMISLRALNDQKINASTPVFLNLVRTHTQRLPSLQSRWISTVLNLTYGATASDTVIRDMTMLSALGLEGREEEFSAALKKSRSALTTLTTQVMRSPQRLGAAVGPELWLAFKQADEISTVNLNTAEKTSLMNVVGFESTEADLLLANRNTHGAFANVADFSTRRDASSVIHKRLTDAHALAIGTGGYQRQ